MDCPESSWRKQRSIFLNRGRLIARKRSGSKPATATTRFERSLIRKGFINIAGIDEAGRGPLAGPVVAAATVLSINEVLQDVNDSKQLSDDLRRSLYEKITASALGIGVGIVWQDEIDRINILQATLKAMALAVADLGKTADYALVDGIQRPKLDIPTAMLIGGDRRCYSIAAASIIAKVVRDDMMIDFDAQFPQYGFCKNKGYATLEHRQAIKRHGPCALHRRSFRWGEG